MKTQQYVPFIFFAHLHVTVKNNELSSVATETQQWVPFALLSSYKICRTAVNNINVLRSSYKLPDFVDRL
jgi:hypothetical protein